VNEDQEIRRYALHDAVDLEYRLPPALTTRTDNFSPGEEITEHDVAVMTEQARLGEQAVADRVLRHARLFAEYIRTVREVGNGSSDHPRA